MPLFQGHKDSGVQRLFIEMPDSAKTEIAWKWPDQQIIQHSMVNVDLDYLAVFTNLGKVIGTLGPGRHPLDEGASLTLGWLVDRLTGDAYYDAELYFVTTRDIANQEFGGPVDNLTDGPTGLVVSLRVFGELAFRVTDPSVLLAKLIGTDGVEDFNSEISTWVEDQALAAIRAVLPDLVSQHGVLAMGQIQEATGDAAVTQANVKLAPYGLALTDLRRAERQPSRCRRPADQAVRRGQGLHRRGRLVRQRRAWRGHPGDRPGCLQRQRGSTAGHRGRDDDGSTGGPRCPGCPDAGVPAPPPAPTGGAPAAGGQVHFCSQCGAALPPGSRFCPGCGASIVGAVPPPASPAPAPDPVPSAPVDASSGEAPS